jgi:hypothetical protein
MRGRGKSETSSGVNEFELLELQRELGFLLRLLAGGDLFAQ